MIANIWLNYISGWWLSPTPLKNDGVSKSWDDDIPNMMGKIIQMLQTTNHMDPKMEVR